MGPLAGESSAPQETGAARVRIYFNGRFLGQPITGVQRFGREIVGALGRIRLQSGSDLRDCVILAPRDVSISERFADFPVQCVGSLSGHLWEQIELPWYSRDGFLINLCNTAPAFKRSQLVVIHDAAVFRASAAYRVVFREWYRALHRQIARSAACVITVSQFSKRDLTACLRPRREILVVGESGEHILTGEADTSVLTKAALCHKRFVLAVSSLNSNKNFGAALRAFELLRPHDYEFVVAGAVNARVFGARSTELSGRVQYVGYVSDRELRALYETASCFVYPSLYEGFGIPPLEAMSCGCAVVAANAASLPEVCGDAAVYCDPSKPEDIARAVRRVMTDDSLREDLRLRGRRRAAAFTWEQAAREIWKAVRKVISSRKSDRAN